MDDAKEEIENAWQWSALRTTLTATTTAGIFNYELNQTDNRFTILDVIDTTNNNFLTYETAHSFNERFILSDPEVGIPRYYSFNGVSTDGDTLVDLYPIPNGEFTIHFNVVLRTSDLVNDTDRLYIPYQPVIQLAYAKAVEERGEDGGATGLSAYLTAQRVASDAIALDAAKHPEETIWYTV